MDSFYIRLNYLLIKINPISWLGSTVKLDHDVLRSQTGSNSKTLLEGDPALIVEKKCLHYANTTTSNNNLKGLGYTFIHLTNPTILLGLLSAQVGFTFHKYVDMQLLII